MTAHIRKLYRDIEQRGLMNAIPRDRLHTAPRVTVTNSAGAGIRKIDPEWVIREAEAIIAGRDQGTMQAPSRDVPKPPPPPKRNNPATPPKRQERPDAVIRELAKAWALPEHLLRTRQSDYLDEALTATIRALRYRCTQLSLDEIAHLVGYSDRSNVCRHLPKKDGDQ